MARLTDQELEVIQRSRVSFLFGVVDGQDGQATTPTSSPAQKPVGLGLIVSLMFRSIKNAIERRRTAAELRRLSPHMLADIGIIPGDIDRVIEHTVDAKRAPEGGPQTVAAAISLWRQQRRAIRELEALDDRALADIGVSRVRIPEVVTTAMSRAA